MRRFTLGMDHTLFTHLARDWEAHGDADPFFGVLSDPDKRGGKWDEEAFFASGRAHIASLVTGLHDAGIAFERGACLDFGCGLGRLTQPLAEYFDRVVGVDVARAMVSKARRYNRRGDRCAFVVNRAPHLRQFADASFDLVHSCIVLQHLPPELSRTYIGEFFRVCRPGGIVVFQAPASLRPAELSAGAFALPPAGYLAEISLAAPLPDFRTGALAEVAIRVTNRSPVAWRHDPPTDEAGHIRLANHWRLPDGTMATRDDGRTPLPSTLAPGETIDLPLVVRPPVRPGAYTLDFDLVQELVTWFEDKGSPTYRVDVEVAEASDRLQAAGDTRRYVHREPLATGTARGGAGAGPQATRRGGFLARLFRRRAGAKPTFPMHVLPRAEVEHLIAARDGQLLRTFEDDACGVGWISYTYVARAHTGPGSEPRAGGSPR